MVGDVIVQCELLLTSIFQVLCPQNMEYISIFLPTIGRYPPFGAAWGGPDPPRYPPPLTETLKWISNRTCMCLQGGTEVIHRSM